MSKVYAPQVPSRFDHGSKLWVPSVDVSPAHKFGELVVMLPPGAERIGPAQCAAAIKEKMRDFTSDDFLIAIGEPSLIAIAAIVADRVTGGRLKVLKWDRLSREYIPVEVTV